MHSVTAIELSERSKRGSLMVELQMCTSLGMQTVRDIVAKVAPTSATILLTGESGVG